MRLTLGLGIPVALAAVLTVPAWLLTSCADLGRLPSQTQGAGRGSDKIAVVLEEDGLAWEAGEIVYQGVMAANAVDRTGSKPAVSLYRIRRQDSPEATIRKALADGATAIIGPLDKDNVQAVANGPAVPVPTLVLNRIPVSASPHPTLVEFTMAPEEEALNVADKARDEGFSGALMLYPKGRWGERMRIAFEERFMQLGGRVFRSQPYDPGGVRYGPPVQALLQTPVEGRVFVFLAINNVEDAGWLWPTLAYYNGRSLPVIASSHVNDRTSARARKHGLEGLFFIDTPWMLIDGIRTAYPPRTLSASEQIDPSSQDRLYAWGIDSYALAKVLMQPANSRANVVDGVTGSLAIGDVRIRRRGMLGLMDFDGPKAVVTLDGALGIARTQRIVEIVIPR